MIFFGALVEAAAGALVVGLLLHVPFYRINAIEFRLV